MFIPYTYFLYHKPTGFKYYGSQYNKRANPNDFWISYFTSCKEVKKLIDLYGKGSFAYKIHKTFSSVEETMEYEAYVLKTFKVLKRKDWLNRNIQGSKFRYPIMSDTHKLALSKANKGKRRKFSLEHRSNLTNALKGLKKSEEHKVKTTEIRRKQSSLDWDKVADIRLRLANGEKIISIANSYNVNRDTIALIRNNKTWVR